MEKTNELITRFHSLQGNNLQEVKRSFNELLDAIQQDVPHETNLDYLIASINPKTKLESALKVEILIRFERYDALLEVLKSGNPMLVRKILKCRKFFEMVFPKIDAQMLVGKIFPHTSFSARMKIITKLSKNLKNEELADAYFRAIDDKYGLLVARGLLPACSLGLIKSTVAAYNLNLTSRQLLKIVKRDQEFLVYYFDVLRQAHGENFDFSEKYPQVLRYVAKIDAQVFWELFTKYRLKVKFGHRMTPGLYENGKKLVEISDYKRGFFSFKKIYKIIRKSEDDLRKFILELYPKDVSDFYADCSLITFLGYLPKNKKYDIVNACFLEAYGKGIHECVTAYIPENILRFVPEQKREAFVDANLLQDESLIYIYPTKKSIPLLRERIKYTSNVSKRSKLATLLSKTCLFNEDFEGLLEVLKYMRSRHKNDNFVLMDFLQNLSMGKTMKKFNGEHWSLIFELLKFVMPNYRVFYYGTCLLSEHFQYAVKNKLPHDEIVRTIFKYLKEGGGYFGNLMMDDVECQKLYFEGIAQLILRERQDDEFLRACCSLLLLMIGFNKRHPKNRIVISRYPELMSAVKIKITKYDFYDANIVINYCLKFEYDDVYDQIYWENFRRSRDTDVVIWYLQNKPGKILEHIDDILFPASIHKFRYILPKLLKLISLVPFKSIPEKVVSFARGGLLHENLKVVKFSAAALSYLTKEHEYFEIIKAFLPPSDGKVDLNTMSESYIIAQEALIKGLSNFNDPTSCLPSLLKFCTGDYMKYALTPLYRVASRVPELKLRHFLDSLYQSPVSIRKHAVDLTVRLEPKGRVYDFLKASGEREKHASLQKVVFKNTLWCLASNPSQKFWDLLMRDIKVIDANDQEAFACLVNLHRIPSEYQPQYVPMIYEILDKNNNPEIRSKKYDLLTSVPNNLIDRLGDSFLKHAIGDTLLQPNAPRELDFYSRSVFHTTSREKQMDLLDVILDVLSTYIKDNWTGDFMCGEVRTDVYDVIRKFCTDAVKTEASNATVEKFLQFWSSSVKEGDLMEEFLLLQLTSAYLSCRSEDKLREYGGKVTRILEDWVGLHGPSVVTLFSEELLDVLREVLVVPFDDERLIGFVDGLLHENGGDFNCVLAMKVIFDLLPVEGQIKSVLKKMRRNESTVVQIYLHQLLRIFEN